MHCFLIAKISFFSRLLKFLRRFHSLSKILDWFLIFAKIISHFPSISFVTSFAGHTLVSTNSKLRNQRIDFNLSCFIEKARFLKISRKPRSKYQTYAAANFQPIHKFQRNVYPYDKYTLNPFGPYRGSASR